ncbi:hypothetical protein JOQ06_021488 [Pogonophryne albipinna]|uniref:Uncharacterized protein n=1 Tax=Pogonophryne albipinna TaxID=1090488 RepID=A0AAD6F5H7_9TELE|nr:hypothetical protein JOQ06_021488 [Pogonophryne albipinna]
MGAGPSTESEREPLLVPSHAETITNSAPVNSRVYGRRWVILTLFSLLALMQGMVWNFWGPIQNSAVHAYGFSKSDIAVLVLWGPVGFVPWLLFMWLLDKRGKSKKCCVSSSTFITKFGCVSPTVAILKKCLFGEVHIRRETL